MKLYTSYFAKIKALSNKDIVPISISLYPPKWYNGLRLMELAPHRFMIKDDITTEQYIVHYKEILSKLDAKALGLKILQLTQNKDAALLCFEKPDEFCHRHLFAEWIKEKTGVEILEYEFKEEKVKGNANIDNFVLPKVPVLYACETDMSKDEIIAIQLSHNSLHGEDDKGILKRLFEQIQSIDFKEMAHINVDEIGVIDNFSSSLVPISEHYNMSLILYKNDIDTLEELIGNIHESLTTGEIVILANQDETEDMMMSLSKEISTKYKIKSSNIVFGKILSLEKKALEHGLDSND